jgi:hypothetical protein
MIESEWTDIGRPLYAELAPLIAEERDAEAAVVFNRKDRSGYVPRRHVTATLARHPVVYGLVRWVVDTRTLPTVFGGGPVDFGLYCLFATILLVVDSDEGLKAGVGDLTSGLMSVPDALVSNAFRSELLAGEVKVSRAEELLGRDIMAAEVEYARKGNQ